MTTGATGSRPLMEAELLSSTSLTNDASEANSEIRKLCDEIVELKREKAEVEVKVKVMKVKMKEFVTKSGRSSQLIDAEAAAAEHVIDETWKVLKEKLPLIGAVSIDFITLAGVFMRYVRHTMN